MIWSWLSMTDGGGGQALALLLHYVAPGVYKHPS